MSPTTKPVRNIKVKVPRHNSQRLGPAVTAQVESLSRERRVRVDVRQTAYEPSSALAQAIVNILFLFLTHSASHKYTFDFKESASEWNSLLLTARAERGPQWDIGTQQYVSGSECCSITWVTDFLHCCRFLVEEYSELYYDPSALLAYQKDARASADGEDAPSTSTNNVRNDRQPQEVPSTPKNQSQRMLNHHNAHTPLHNPPQYFTGNVPPNMASPRHPFPSPGPGMASQGMGGHGMSGQSMGQGMNYGNMNMNMGPVSPAQFYGGGNPGMAQGMGGMGMNMPAGMGMGMGMGMGGDGMVLGMGSPDPRRRITRGMSAEDGFGGMHG